MPIDPEVEKAIKDLQATILSLQEELKALKAAPNPSAGDIKALQDDLKAAKAELSEIKKNPGKPPRAPDLESDDSSLAGFWQER